MPSARSSCHARYCPAQKASPSSKVIKTQAPAFCDVPACAGSAARTRRAISTVKLLARRIRVLKYNTVGRVRWLQSEVPSRTNSALVNAAKLIVIANTPTQMPLLEARACFAYASAAWAEARLDEASAFVWELTVDTTLEDIFTYFLVQ